MSLVCVAFLLQWLGSSNGTKTITAKHPVKGVQGGDTRFLAKQHYWCRLKDKQVNATGHDEGATNEALPIYDSDEEYQICLMSGLSNLGGANAVEG